MLSIEEFLLEIVYLFLPSTHFITFKTLQEMMVWQMKKRNKANIFTQFVFLPIPIKTTKTILKLDDQSHAKRKEKQSTEVLLKRLLFKI